MTNNQKFEYLDRIYMPYTYWRRHVAPWRSELDHKNYFPTLEEFKDYYFLAYDDGYYPYGLGSGWELEDLWIRYLDGLRVQIGWRPLDGHEEREALDNGKMMCYN